MIEFYTDGACNQKYNGGWAWYCNNLNILVCGNKSNTTNNQMELEAIYHVLSFVIKCNITNNEINICTDSAYCIGVIEKGWNISSNDLLINDIKRLIYHLREYYHLNIQFVKVPGHSNILGNEICDYFAVLKSNELN